MISVFQRNILTKTRKQHTDSLHPPKLWPSWPYIISLTLFSVPVPGGTDFKSQKVLTSLHRCLSKRSTGNGWALMTLRGGCWGGQACSVGDASVRAVKDWDTAKRNGLEYGPFRGFAYAILIHHSPFYSAQTHFFRCCCLKLTSWNPFLWLRISYLLENK